MSSLTEESASELGIRERCLIMQRDRIEKFSHRGSCKYFLRGRCGHQNCRFPHFSTIEIDGILYATDLRFTKKFDTTSVISQYVNHPIRQKLSDHDALQIGDMIIWNTMSRLGTRQKESIMNYGGDWHGFPTGAQMPWDELRFVQIADHITSDEEFTRQPIMCFQEMDYSIVQLLMSRLEETHHFSFTESYTNSNAGGLLTVLRKDSYLIEGQMDHADVWLDSTGTEASKLVGSLVTIRNINNGQLLKILNVHLDLKSAVYSIPELIKSIVSNNIDYVIGDFNLPDSKINELLRHESFRIELTSQGYDHICKIIR